MTDAEIEALIEATADPVERETYVKMLTQCQLDSGNRLWHAPWAIKIKKTTVTVGNISFHGPARNASVEVGYAISPEFWGNGYATEALKGMTEWALSQEGVTFVEAETTPTNHTSQHILEKCGFEPDGEGAIGPRFVLESSLPSWTSIYMLLGLSIGLCAGSASDNTPIGIAMGLCLGLLIGAAMDSNARAARTKARKERKGSKEDLRTTTEGEA